MNASYFYDIEMPPAVLPWWVSMLIVVLLLALSALVLLRKYRQYQPEMVAMEELRSLSTEDPYHLAALLRQGLQYKHLPGVLPELLMHDLNLARYAPSPEIELPKLFAEAEKVLAIRSAELGYRELLRRLISQLKALPVQRYWQLSIHYLSDILEDFFSWIKRVSSRLLRSLWGRKHD